MASRFLGLSLMLAILAVLAPPAAALPMTACFENWPPYAIMPDARGVNGAPTSGEAKATGLSVALHDRIMADLGHTVTYTALPYERCVESVKRGTIDMVVSSGGEEGLVVANAYKVVWALGFFVPDDTELHIYSSLEAFAGKRIGIVQQFDYPDEIKNFKDWSLIQHRDDRYNFRMMAVGRLDAVLTDVPWALHLGLDTKHGARLVRPLVKVVPQPDGFRPGLEPLRDAFDTVLTRLITDGAVEQKYRDAIGLGLSQLIAGRADTRLPLAADASHP